MADTPSSLTDLRRALETLDAAIQQVPSLTELERDGLIQRFEYSYELTWKTAKRWLEDQGIEAHSPKSVFRELRAVDIIDEEHLARCFAMIVDRNLVAHTYNQRLAGELASRIPGHAVIMRHIAEKIATA